MELHDPEGPLDELHESTSWMLLRSVDVGRIATATTTGGIEIFPVNHLVDQGSIVFRTAAGTKLSSALAATEVAFEADNAAPRADRQDEDPWSVVVHGQAELIIRPGDIFEAFDLQVRPWHTSDKPYFVRIVPDRISGRRFRL